MGYAILRKYKTEKEAIAYKEGFLDCLELETGKKPREENYRIFKEEDGEYSINFD